MSRKSDKSGPGIGITPREFKDNKALDFNTQIETKATVDRHKIENALSHRMSRDLRKIGELGNPIKDTLLYQGSMAVHVYQSPLLEQIYFTTQLSSLGKVSEIVASKALMDLMNAAQAHYGRTPQTKRSGF